MCNDLKNKKQKQTKDHKLQVQHIEHNDELDNPGRLSGSKREHDRGPLAQQDRLRAQAEHILALAKPTRTQKVSSSSIIIFFKPAP